MHLPACTPTNPQRSLKLLFILSPALLPLGASSKAPQIEAGKKLRCPACSLSRDTTRRPETRQRLSALRFVILWPMSKGFCFLLFVCLFFSLPQFFFFYPLKVLNPFLSYYGGVPDLCLSEWRYLSLGCMGGLKWDADIFYFHWFTFIFLCVREKHDRHIIGVISRVCDSGSTVVILLQIVVHEKQRSQKKVREGKYLENPAPSQQPPPAFPGGCPLSSLVFPCGTIQHRPDLQSL